MPQIFQVLKCYKCLVFQVHQAKKSNKFVCKMCGEKQSIKRHYGIGNGQECRLHVQKLNGIRGEIDVSKSTEDYQTSDDDDLHSHVELKRPTKSKWSDFLNTNEVEETNDDDDDGKMFLDNTEVVLEVQKKKHQKKSVGSHRSHKGLLKSDSVEMEREETVLYNQNNFFIKKPNVVNCDKDDSVDFYQPNNKNLKKEDLHYGLESLANNDNNLSTQNILHEELKIKSNQVKFKPPVINPNSKWAKFTDNETNLLYKDALEGHLSPNIIETEHENDVVGTQDTMNLNNMNVKKNEICTVSNMVNCFVDQSDIEEYGKESHSTENKDNLNLNNLDKKDPTHKSNDCLQKDSKGLFSLCDDTEIDDFLDI